MFSSLCGVHNVITPPKATRNTPRIKALRIPAVNAIDKPSKSTPPAELVKAERSGMKPLDAIIKTTKVVPTEIPVKLPEVLTIFTKADTTPNLCLSTTLITDAVFGDPNMPVRKSNPKARASFRARHKCSTAKDKTTARYWACRDW